MRTIRTLLFIILCFCTIQQVLSQSLDVRSEIRDGELVLLVQNNIPCPCTIFAEHELLTEDYNKLFSKGEEKVFIKLPADSVAEPEKFKEDIEFSLILGDPNAIPDPKYQYLLPFPQGESYRLTQGNKSRFTHNKPNTKYAFDFEMPIGSYVAAARGGIVGYVEVENKEGGIEDVLKDRGNQIFICHDDGTVGAYGHLKHKGALVEVGDPVFAGQVIALSGNTGFSTDPHLHFAVLAGPKSVPIRFRNLPDPLEPHRFYEQNLGF